MKHSTSTTRVMDPPPGTIVKRSHLARSAAVLMLGPVWFGASALPAQEQPAGSQAQSAESSAPAVGLEEITVTATRRAESESRVPVSITAFTQEQMDSQGLRQIDDLVRFTPGLNFNNGGNGANDVSIR